MSERMTDAEAIAADAGVTASGWDAGDKSLAGRIRADWLRARSAEVERDATIKALADALEHVSKASVNERVWNDQTGAVDDMQKIVRAALRLAGRMP